MTVDANEGPAPGPVVYDAWFRAKIREALENAAPLIPHAEVEAHFTRRRAALRPGKHSAKPAT